MSEIALRLQGVHVAYGNSQQSISSGFSMSVRKGEIACLLGALDCGKTTVLRAVAGFERLQNREIYASQRRVASPGVHLLPEKRHVGMVFQEYALFPHLTAQQNVAFGLRRMPREGQQAGVTELLKMVELHGHVSHYPHELFGGQQQRIVLVRALAPYPEILLLDEPFSSLDKRMRERLGNEVRDILCAAGQTALLVTYSEHEAQLMADHIGVVKMGQYQIKKAPHPT